MDRVVLVRWREYLFVSVAFLLGSVNILYSGVFYAVMTVAFLVNVGADYRGFWKSVWQERKYVLLPVIGVIYLIVHYLCSLFLAIPYRPSWSFMELLLMFFLLVPLYLLSARNMMTPLLLRRTLLALCAGILLFNFVKLFCVIGLSLFTNPVEALSLLYSSRFGGNMDLLGKLVILEPQALYIAVAAVIAYYFILAYHEVNESKRFLYANILVFVLSLIFLSFTVTKGAILGFGAGFLVLSIWYVRRHSSRERWRFIGGLVVLVLLVGWLMPQAYFIRLEQTKREITGVLEDNYAGGSIAPRWGLMKENFRHFDEWGIVGLGVYQKKMTKEWYSNSPYIQVPVNNSHNSFMEFWLTEGIFGLLFLLYYFVAPFLRMRRNRLYSVLCLATVLTIFVAANTCVVVTESDSRPFVVFMLSIFFLYAPCIGQLEDSRTA
ncbi:MAG: O-antigen ligase family protein [Odoribacter sp.]|nr:O-antigen ligase family protein [Odoribacter sp.]